MKKSLLVLAIASTLAACGGGGGGGDNLANVATPPVVVNPPPVTQLDMGERYFDDKGGEILFPFAPTDLPTWLKKSTSSSVYTVEANPDCTNRNAVVSNTSTKITIVQTSKYQCSLGDFNVAQTNDVFGMPNRWGTETSVDPKLRLFSPNIIDSRITQVNNIDWPIRRGQGQIKVQVQKGDCTGTDCTRSDGARDRAEFVYTEAGDVYKWLFSEGDERWINFSFYMPKPYKEQGGQPNTSQTTTLFQIMTTFLYDQQNSPFTDSKFYGTREWLPMLQIAKQFNGDLVARTWSTSGPYTVTKLISDGDFEGHWHDIVIKYKAWASPVPKTQMESFSNITLKAPYPTLEIWVNGVKKLTFDNRSLTTADSSVYFKWGLYRPTSGENITTEIYFDELRVGKTRAEVEVK